VGPIVDREDGGPCAISTILPAKGGFFLANYRIIFKKSHWDLTHQQREKRDEREDWLRMGHKRSVANFLLKFCLFFQKFKCQVTDFH
jgi:hypothetical protein